VDVVLWVIGYPAHVEPIGLIRRERDDFRAWLHKENLGLLPSGDG
jgi:hypothetical protein